jgi:hypothetical protein
MAEMLAKATIAILVVFIVVIVFGRVIPSR